MGEDKKEFVQKYCVTIALILANVGVWGAMELIGSTESSDFMMRHGAMYTGALDDAGQYYRLISAIFLHFGVEHLANNMLILALLGSRLEESRGHINLLSIFFISGIVGNLISYEMAEFSNEIAVSAGASGAVFGILGALIALTISRSGKKTDLSFKGLLLMAGLSIYYGFTAEGVDNVCHISGLLCGFVIEFIIGKVIDFIRKN